MAFFSVWTLFLYHKQAAAHPDRSIPRRRLLPVGAALLLALLAKGSAVVVPVFLVIQDLWLYNRFSDRPWLWRVGIALREKAALFALSLLAGGAAIAASHSVTAMISFEEYGVANRLAQTATAIRIALTHCFWPFQLTPLSELREKPSLLHNPTLLTAAGLALLTLALLASPGRRRLTAAWLAFLVALLPVSGFFQSGPQVTADRFTYLSCLAWAMFCGLGLWLALPARRGVVRAAAVLCAVGAVGLAALTWRQQTFWRDTRALWSRVIAIDPESYFGLLGMGKELYAQQQPEAAIPYLRRALDVHADASAAWLLLGRIELARGRCGAAADAFQRALHGNAPTAEAQRLLEEAAARAGR
jgi:tetratricopeptide (TPR) repeat protein